MRIFPVSDLHVEHLFALCGGDPRAALAILDDALPAPDLLDVLVIAGDLDGATVDVTLGHIADRYAPRPVLYVMGNHELYGADIHDQRARLSSLKPRHENLTWLDNDLATLGGQVDESRYEYARFVGAPLWFDPYSPAAITCRPWPLHAEHPINDFNLIPDAEQTICDEHAASMRMLRAHVPDADVVITHHAPSPRSVHPRYAGNRLNCFFYTDLEPMIEAATARPRLWIHGHMHDPVDYVIGTTRVIANPAGYPIRRAFEMGARPWKFDVSKIIDWPPPAP